VAFCISGATNCHLDHVRRFALGIALGHVIGPLAA
jgi:hypothetical protein